MHESKEEEREELSEREEFDEEEEDEYDLRILRGGPLLDLPKKKEWKKGFKKSEEEE